MPKITSDERAEPVAKSPASRDSGRTTTYAPSQDPATAKGPEDRSDHHLGRKAAAAKSPPRGGPGSAP